MRHGEHHRVRVPDPEDGVVADLADLTVRGGGRGAGDRSLLCLQAPQLCYSWIL
jgi:hypothetical protein